MRLRSGEVRQAERAWARSEAAVAETRVHHRRSPWIGGAFIALLSCTVSACDDDVSCPEFDVSAWCSYTGMCTVDGVPACPGNCEVPKDIPLEIPIDETLAEALIERREVGLDVFAHTRAQVVPTEIEVRLDGVLGKHIPPPREPIPRWSTVVQWDPFPQTPELLTVLYSSGTPETADVHIDLVDYQCALEDPPEFNPQ